MTDGITFGVEAVKIEKADTSYFSHEWGTIPRSPTLLVVNIRFDHDRTRSYDRIQSVGPGGVPETAMKLVMQYAHASYVQFVRYSIISDHLIMSGEACLDYVILF